MKTRLLILATLFALAASVAVAGSSSYLLNGTNQTTAPSGASQTGAITIANGFRGVGVAIADFNDGGADQDLISGAVRGYAWIYSSSNVNPDGGAGWLRYPRLDVQGIADAGGAAAAGQNGVQGQFFTIDPVVTSGFFAQKLYYTTSGVTYDDAGVAVHQVTITTLY